MRIEPENGIVELMRGDTLIMPIYINEGTKLEPEYRPLDETERLYFGLMEPGQAFEDAVLKKVLDSTTDKDEDGNPLLRLNSNDTERLLTGKYYYMVKLRKIDASGQEFVKTIISPTLFWLQGNNTTSEDVWARFKHKHTVDDIVDYDTDVTERIQAETNARVEDVDELQEQIDDVKATADTAIQSITTTENGGLKVTGTNQIDVDDSVEFIIDGGTAADI